MAFYRRNLPHWHPRGKALFITWRLHSSVEYPHCLARADLAQIVTEALLYTESDLRHYDLYAWVVMSNHVHILVQPLAEPAVFLKSVKGFTARQANRVLNRTGVFWQREFFDRWLRGDVEIGETVAYIQANPVRAGLVTRPEEFPWSSASPAWRPELPQTQRLIETPRLTSHVTFYRPIPPCFQRLGVSRRRESLTPCCNVKVR